MNISILNYEDATYFSEIRGAFISSLVLDQ